jgi:hypothetical protein
MTPRGRKPRMPEVLRALGDAALTRIRKNSAAPMIWEMPKEGESASWASGWFVCPYAKQDEDRWFGLVMSIFGTRQEVVAHMFMTQLAALCDRNWKAPEGWRTDEVQMTQLLVLIHDMRPRNASEAALAAQLCALHLSMMKLGAAQAHTWGGDARAVAIMAKTSRAYADGLMALEKLKGRANKTRQTIKVEKHTHTHQHIHLEGDEKFGGQPHAKATDLIAKLRSLPSSNEGGEIVRFPSGEGEAGLQDARRRKSRRAEREG